MTAEPDDSFPDVRLDGGGRPHYDITEAFPAPADCLVAMHSRVSVLRRAVCRSRTQKQAD